MAKRRIPDVKTDGIEMSARDFPSANRKVEPLVPPPPSPTLREVTPPPQAPQEAPQETPQRAPASPVDSSTSRNASLTLGAAVIACIAAIVSVAAPALRGLSGVERAEPVNVAAPVAAAPAPAATQPGLSGRLLSLTILDLSRALETSRPYGSELAAARILGAEDGDVIAFVDALEPYAATGVGTQAELQAALSRLSGEIDAAFQANERSWTKRTTNSLRSILTFWRPAPEPAERKVHVALARAEDHLANGRIEGAIGAISDLDGPAGVAVAPLIQDMERRLAADRAATALSELALNRLAGRE